MLAWVVFRLFEVSQQNLVHPPSDQRVRVVRVIDGDTLLIEGDLRVRLLGINTPETRHPTLPEQPFGAEASQFTKSMVAGKKVDLIFDKERFDNYQRILAFVYVDGEFLNEQLVRAGLATAETQYPYRSDLKRILIDAEADARAKKIGIWSTTNPTNR